MKFKAAFTGLAALTVLTQTMFGIAIGLPAPIQTPNTSGGGSASVTLFPSASASGSGVSKSSNAFLGYFFEVFGPQNGTVTLDFAGFSSATYSNASVNAHFDVYTQNGSQSLLDYSAQCSQVNTQASSCSGDPLGAFNLQGVFSTNTIYRATLMDAGSTSPAGGSYSVTIDPMISIDVAQLNPQSYSLQFSAGIQNLSGQTPEPGTIVLLSGGVAILWIAQRRRRAVRV